jgi:hypothetical protein
VVDNITTIYINTNSYTMLKHNMQTFYINPDMFRRTNTPSSGETHLTLKTHKPSCYNVHKTHYYLNQHMLTQYVEVCLVQVVCALKVVVYW